MHVLCLLRVDVWQAAAPAYAQATLSLWSDLLFNGHLVDASPSSGGMPSPNLSEDCGYSFCDKQSIDPGQSWWYPELLRQYWPKPTTYRVWGGHGQDLVIMTRKHEARGQYVIVGSIQPQSNIVGNTPLNVTACIVLEGTQLNFTVRRQGSVYLYSPSTAVVTSSAVAAPPSFVQLDGWHEHTHFSWWSSDFILEAELFEGFTPSHAAATLTRMEQSIVHTELPSWQVGDTSIDLTQARAYISLGGGDNRRQHNGGSFAYVVEPRQVSRSELTEVGASGRSYRVELVMRLAPSPAQPELARPSSPQACVVVRLARKLGTNGTTEVDKEEDVGVACVDGDSASSSSLWQRVVVKASDDAAVLLRLETAHKHQVLLEGLSAAAVHVDQLRLVQMSEER